MTARTWNPRRPANLTLIIMCAGAAVWLAAATLVAVPSANMDRQDIPAGRTKQLAAPAAVNPDNYGAIYEQPIFNEGHRALSTGLQQIGAVSPAGPMTLVGTVGTGTRRGATIVASDGAHHAVTEGQIIDGWRIVSIGDGFVVIDKDGQSQQLTLYREPQERKAQEKRSQ